MVSIPSYNHVHPDIALCVRYAAYTLIQDADKFLSKEGGGAKGA